MADGAELGSSCEISRGGSLGSEDVSELGYPIGRVSGEDSEGLEVCATGDVSNGKSSGNLGGNPLGGVLGSDNGL